MKQIDLLLQPQSMASAMFATIEIISLANRMARNLSGDIETSPFGWRTVDALGKPFTLVDPVLGEGRYSAYDAECDERTDVAGKETAGVALVIPPVRASNLAMHQRCDWFNE